jgi:hypothetical protein
MRPRSIVVKNRYLVSNYFGEETDAVIKYRLSFLNALQGFELDLEKTC